METSIYPSFTLRSHDPVYTKDNIGSIFMSLCACGKERTVLFFSSEIISWRCELDCSRSVERKEEEVLTISL